MEDKSNGTLKISTEYILCAGVRHWFTQDGDQVLRTK